ncbi:MAG: hypothetical protein AAGA20_17315 [Planctomycetota bacterium]
MLSLFAIIALLHAPLVPGPPATAAPVVKDDQPDLITLKDGKEIECRVLLEGDEVILARVRSRKKEFPREDVFEIQSIERSLRDFFTRYDVVQGSGVDGIVELAMFCEERGLYAEARILWIKILTQDAENEQAWTKLGGVYNERRGWRLKVRGRFYNIEQLRERVADWRNAMELPTSHFLLRTDIAPERALDVALNLERAYLAYYDILGKAVDLQVFDDVPEVNVYKNPDDFPTPKIQGDTAWFSRGQNTVHVNGAVPNVGPRAVFQLTHSLVYNSFRRTIGGNGSIAPWTERAMAEMFAGAVRVENGVARWEFGTPIQQYFQMHASDEKPLTLKKLIAAGYGAYNSGTDAPRYIAQSYTLFDFLLFGEDGKYRDGVGDYMAKSFKGQSAATHLEKSLGEDLDVVEEQWTAYVHSVAGR